MSTSNEASASSEAGTWTLTAPNGRTWQAESPLRCVSKERNERVPASVQLARIQAEADKWCEGGIHAFNIGERTYVAVERHGRWVTVIDESGIFSHIVEPSGIDKCLSEAGLI